MNIGLLYLANQLGKKISKFALVHDEYLRAILVKGQRPLKIAKTRPSPNMIATASQEYADMLSVIPLHITKPMTQTINAHIRVCTILTNKSLVS
jgi:hypothetical protein